MMVHGPEWDFVEEIKYGKTISKLFCKFCGVEFNGGATRIVEHIFGVGINIGAFVSLPSNAHVKLYKYITKYKVKGIPIGKKAKIYGRKYINVGRHVDVSTNEIRDDQDPTHLTSMHPMLA